MSQSISKLEGLIFACAPTGIITAMIGAIRAGGSGVLQAIIGRARESRAIVELELMSSTSADVCDLWNGHGVIRVLGSSPIIELYYLVSDPESSLNFGPVDGDAISLMGRDKEDLGIWDFKSAIVTRLLENMHFPRSESRESLSLGAVVPNLGLNLIQRVSDLELMFVSVIGIVLQTGVVVFAAVGVYLSDWNEKFEKGGKRVPWYLVPSMAGGTGALAIGMFLCCYIVERSTTEDTWAINEPDGHRVRVAWL